MGTFKPAKALGLDIHLLVDGGLENKVRMFPLPHFNLRATICCADSQGGCLGWDRIRMISSHLPFILWCKRRYPRRPSLVSCSTLGWLNEGGSQQHLPLHFPTRARNSIRVKQLSGSYLLLEVICLLKESIETDHRERWK